MSTRRGGDRKEDWADLVERQIREAMARGAFRDLPGKGKPLDLERNPFLDESLEVAYKVLRDGGFAPEWIEADKEVRARVDDWRRRLRAAWEAFCEEVAASPSVERRRRAEEMWRRRWERLRRELDELNEAIDIANLKTPMAWLHRPRLRVERELQRAKQNRNPDPVRKGEDT